MSLTKKYKLILISVFVFFGLFVTLKPAQAIIGTGIFDWSTAVLDAFDFIDQAILSRLTTLIIYAFLSSAFVTFSAYLLEWAFQLPLYLQNPVVLGGWHFVLGLVNLFFVLAFVAIALAYILKIETFQLKKALPRLLIVALLVNFSMLIVGLFVDMAQFFMNTFLGAFGTDFVTMATLPLKQIIGSLVNVLVTTVGAYIVSGFTVFGSIFSLSWILFQVFAGDLLGNIFAVVTLIAFNLLMGAIFFIYAVLFFVRIAALWILTIFAPLAFFALVFSQTKKYAEMWFKAVFQWAFLGVVAFFLLGLITSLFTGAFLERPGEMTISAAPGIPGFELPPAIYNYLFLIIFLAVAFYISIKYVPIGAGEVIGFMKGRLAAMGGVGGIMSKAKGGLSGAARRITPESVRKEARRLATTPTKIPKEKWEKMTRGERMKHRLISPYFKRRVGRGIVGATEEADVKALNQAQEEGEKLGNAMLLSKIQSTPPTDQAKRAGYINAAAETGRLDDLKNEKKWGANALTENDSGRAHEKAATLGQKKVYENIEKGFPEHYKTFGKTALKEGLITQNDLDKKFHGSYAEKTMAGVRSEKDMKMIARSLMKFPSLMNAFLAQAGSHQLKMAGRIIGREAVNEIEKRKSKDPRDYIKKGKADVLRFYASTAAQDAGYSAIPGAERKEEINKLVKGEGKPSRRPRPKRKKPKKPLPSGSPTIETHRPFLGTP